MFYWFLLVIFAYTYARKMDNNKLGYAEFNENLLYMSRFNEQFLIDNEAFLKDVSYFLWEDYVTEELFVGHYVKILTSILDKVGCYGIKW